METENPDAKPERETGKTEKQGGESQQGPAAPSPVEEPPHSEAKERDAEEGKDETDREQDEAIDKLAENTELIAQQTKWERMQGVWVRNQFWASLGLGLLTLYVLAYQTCTLSKQLEAMQSSSNDTQKMIVAMQQQANASQNTADRQRDIAEQMGRQANATINAADAAAKQANTSAISANAAQTQAETSQQLVRQNRQAVDAAVGQSKAAQASADISRQTFTLLERPSLGIEGAEEPKLEVGKPATMRVAVKNYGHIPARNVTVEAKLFALPVTNVNAPCPEPVKTSEYIGLPSRTILPVNGVRYATPFGNGIIRQEDITLINVDKTYWVYVYIQTVYGDRGEYFLEYYARHNVDTKSWEECNSHNRAN